MESLTIVALALAEKDGTLPNRMPSGAPIVYKTDSDLAPWVCGACATVAAASGEQVLAASTRLSPDFTNCPVCGDSFAA